MIRHLGRSPDRQPSYTSGPTTAVGDPHSAVALSTPGVVAAGALMLALTAPGQTSAVSVFVDPMLADLTLTRPEISIAYTIGSLIAAAGLVAVGAAVDRWGVRAVLARVAVAFGASLAGMAVVAGPVTLAVGFAAIRLLGAGALNLLSTTAVALRTERHRGTAIGLAAAIGSAGISVAPLALQRLVDGIGWRLAWLIAALAIWLLLIPLAVTMPAGSPTQPATPTDQHQRRNPPRTPGHVPIAHPLRSPFFWTLLTAVAVNSLIGTGLIFHQTSLLAEHGLTPTAAAATFLPQTAAGLLAAAAAGRLADHVHPHHLLIPNMALTAGALLLAPHVAPGWPALAYAATLGASIGAIRTVESTCLAYYFDPGNLGKLRGLTLTAIVLAAAPGPLPLAWAHASTGSYTTATTTLLILPAAVAAATLLTTPATTRPATNNRTLDTRPASQPAR
jgi:MFS family permease